MHYRKYTFALIAIAATVILCKPLSAEETPTLYGATAGGVWKVNGKVQVSIGYAGHRKTPDEAMAAALAQCQSGGGQNCKVTNNGNAIRGCVFITTGRKADLSGWYGGPSAERVMANCREDGFSCKTPIGGCNN